MELDHIELFVSDPIKAVSWYGKSLGFRILRKHYHWFEGGGPLMISNDGGKTMLALFSGEPQGESPVAGIRRIAFRVSADDFVKFMETSGSWRDQLLDNSNIEDHDQPISVYFSDPYGNLLEVTTCETDGIREQLGLITQ